jgi:ubiquinone/menaquinone biosynthesis C-methylase UbiE
MEDSAAKLPKGAGKSSFELLDAGTLSSHLPIKPGSVVMDLACGKGAYSLFLSGIVGENGLIYAVDLWKEGLLLLEEEIDQRGVANIRTLHADVTTSDQVDIDGHSVDLCLMATVLHDFEEAHQAGPVLELIRNVVKPRGYLAVIEFKKMEGPPGPPMEIRLSADEVDQMVAAHCFRHMKTVDLGDYTYLMIFQWTG